MSYVFREQYYYLRTKDPILRGSSEDPMLGICARTLVLHYWKTPMHFVFELPIAPVTWVTFIVSFPERVFKMLQNKSCLHPDRLGV